MAPGDNKPILWIAADPHSPDQVLHFGQGLCWHAPYGCESLKHRFLEDMGSEVVNANDIRVRGNSLDLLGRQLNLQDYGALLFTWNPIYSRPRTIRRLHSIERAVAKVAPQTTVWNRPSQASVVFSKLEFFEAASRAGLDVMIPEYRSLGTWGFLSRLRSLPLGQWIITPETGSSGKNQTLVEITEATGMWKILRYQVQILKPNFRWLTEHTVRFGSLPRWLAIRYVDHYRNDFGTYVSYRAFFHDSQLWFAYPHVSTKNWNTHTNEPNRPSAKVYGDIVKEMEFTLRETSAQVNQINKFVLLDIFALDFLMVDGSPVFLEAEIKYGPDGNFVEGQLVPYGEELALPKFIPGGIHQPLCADKMFEAMQQRTSPKMQNPTDNPEDATDED